MNRKTSKRIVHAVSYLALGIGAVIMLVPLIWAFTTSLKTTNEACVYPPTFFGKEILWSNYLKISDRFNFLNMFKNTSIVTIASVILQLTTSAMAGFAFSYLKFRGRDRIFMLFLFSMMVPYHVLLVPTFMLLKKLNLINTLWALILPTAVTPFGAFLMRQSFMSLPSEMGEAAKIDGCNPWGVFTKMFLPLAKPALTTLGIFTVVGSWNDFLRPLIYLTDDSLMTITLGIYNMQGAFSTNWPVLMCTVMVSIIPVLIIFVCLQDLFVEGVALTGMK